MTEPYTSGQVERRLYEAGRTLLALRVSGCWPASFRSSMPEMLREAVAEYGYVKAESSVPPPLAREVSAMDQALSWVRLLPGETAEDIRIRKLVWSRMLVNPRSNAPIYSWKRLAPMFGCSHPHAKTLWLRAVERITIALNRPGLCAAAGGPLGHGPAIPRFRPRAASPALALRVLEAT